MGDRRIATHHQGNPASLGVITSSAIFTACPVHACDYEFGLEVTLAKRLLLAEFCKTCGSKIVSFILPHPPPGLPSEAVGLWGAACAAG